MQLSATGLKAFCFNCKKTFDVNGTKRQEFIEKYGCDDCRLDETEGGEMAKAKIKGEPEKATIKEIIKKHPQLVKAEGKEHPVVKEAKAKKIEVDAKLPGLEEPQQERNPLIEQYAIEKKKVSKSKVALMAEEAKLDANIRELLKAAGLTHYKSDEVDVELVPTKDKLKIKILDEEEEED